MTQNNEGKEKEFLDFDYKYDKKKAEKEEVRNVKEEVARVVQQARDTNSLIREQLLLGDSRGEKPMKDLRKETAEVSKVVTRRMTVGKITFQIVGLTCK